MSKPVMRAVKSVVGQKLELHEIGKPSPGPGQVLIRVHAVAEHGMKQPLSRIYSKDFSDILC